MMPMQFTVNIAGQSCKFKKKTDEVSLLLPVAHGEQSPAEIPEPGARVNNGNSLRVWQGKAHTYGVAAKFLKASLTNGN